MNNKVHVPQSEDYWRKLVLTNVHVRPGTEERIDAVVKLCVETDQAGAPVGVWHACATVFGYLDRCRCWPCMQAREKAKGVVA